MLSDLLSKPLPLTLHATAVTFAGRGLLLLGPSGAGKSSIALQMMGLGAGLIGDDMIHIAKSAGRIDLSSPVAQGAAFGIEARGLGLLAAHRMGNAPLALVADLAQVEQARLPAAQQIEIDGIHLPFIKKVDNPAFPAMLMQYLSHGPLLI